MPSESPERVLLECCDRPASVRLYPGKEENEELVEPAVKWVPAARTLPEPEHDDPGHDDAAAAAVCEVAEARQERLSHGSFLSRLRCRAQRTVGDAVWP